MTTVERYPPTQLQIPSDVPSNVPRSHSPSNTIARNNYIPPAVPSPPRLSARSSPPRRPHIQAKHEHTIGMASEASNQWLFTDAELVSTPSVLDGLPIAEERCRRAKGVNFIFQAGILLKLPQLTLATASVFFHRFYMRASMVPEKGGLHHYNIAATSLFLATKTEENCRKTKEIVIAVAKVAQKNASLIIDEQSKEYWRWRDNILLYEELMLEYLTFDVVLQSPYSFLYSFLQKLRIEDNKQLRNVAWAFLNDSCLTMLCLAMSPKDIAIAALYFAAKFTGERIPDAENGQAWWERLGGKPDLIIKAVGIIYEFYTENPLKRSDNPYAQSPSSIGNEEDLERTRARNSSSSQDIPSPGEIAPSQRSQNGNIEHANGSENSAAVLNGNKTPAEPSTQPNGNAKTESPQVHGVPEISAPATAAGTSSKAADESGSSDAALKEAANDPATHGDNGHSNGMAELLPTANPTAPELAKASSKRKEIEDAEEPPAKKKAPSTDDVDTTVATILTSEPTEEGEEGELEE